MDLLSIIVFLEKIIMPINNDNDFNNTHEVLETKLSNYKLLLDYTILMMYTSPNCPTENTFALQMLDLIFLGWWKGEKLQMSYYCDNACLHLHHASEAGGAWLPQPSV